MTTEPEIQAAAERLVAMEYEDIDALSAMYHIKQDAQIVARGRLSQHQADDDVPVDEEWFLSIGFVESSNYGNSLKLVPKEWGYVKTKTIINVWRGNDKGDWQVRADLLCVNRHKSFETRGDVRHLCRALGVELKEKTNVGEATD